MSADDGHRDVGVVVVVTGSYHVNGMQMCTCTSGRSGMKDCSLLIRFFTLMLSFFFFLHQSSPHHHRLLFDTSVYLSFAQSSHHVESALNVQLHRLQVKPDVCVAT